MSTLKRRHGECPEGIQDEDGFIVTKPNWDFVTSTGSTLLDLAISGKRLEFGGVPSGILMEVAGASQSGKCVSRNNYITSDDGVYSVDEFFEKLGFPAYKVNKTVFLEEGYAKLPNMFGNMEGIKALTFNGLRPLTRIKTASGIVHEVTLNHPLKVMTKNGNLVWKHASNIEKGEYVLFKLSTTRKSSEEEKRLCKQAYVAGLFVADGYLGGNVGFTNNESFLINRVSNFLDENNIRYRITEVMRKGLYSTTQLDLTSNSGSDKLREILHLGKCKSAGKSVPLIYRTSGREVAISFLKGYFDCEAYFNNSIEVTSASKKLLDQVQQMLLGIGSVSTLRKKKVKSYPNTDYWRLSIFGDYADNYFDVVGTSLLSRKNQINSSVAGTTCSRIIPYQKENVADFAAEIFYGGKTREQGRLIGPTDRNLTFDQVFKLKDYFSSNNITLKKGFGESIFEMWHILSSGGYHFTEVIDNCFVDHKDWTYDFSMEKTASFLLNGCVSHNTLILTEMAARVQKKGGGVFFADPEDRLDKEYASITGLDIRDNGEYERPDTVTEFFEFYNKWEVDPSKMNIFCGDSLAALSTKMEMEDGDKMGMRRAKEFSEALRVSCRTFKKKNVLMVCSNQIRDGGHNGSKTIPGGNAVPFYSTVRLKMEPGYPKSKIKKEKTIRGAKQEKVIGVISNVTVHKNSLDDPWRKVPLHIVFGYGIDDIRANLTWYKESTNSKKFIVPGGIELATIDKAIEYVEENALAKKLRIDVRDLWREIEESFKQNRKPKEF